MNQIKNIIIVGGGSAGWMTAATLIKCFPYKKITLIEHPDIPTIGVGESTLGFIREWQTLLEIKDKDFISQCDASFKLSIKFTDFYKKGELGKSVGQARIQKIFKTQNPSFGLC